MYYSTVLTLLVYFETSVAFSLNHIVYNLTVRQTPNALFENVTSTETIKLQTDAFHLLIVNNSIEKISENLVVISNDLTVLEIFNSSVRELTPGGFNIVPQLALLKISVNLLETIKTGVFNRVKTKEIDLSRNFITHIEETAFDNVTTLEIVKLDYNLIKEINPNWFNNCNVYQLSIIYNELTKIDNDTFQNFVKNRPLRLVLSANRIEHLSPEMFDDFDTVDILRLNGNVLEALPPNIFQNTSISTLQLNKNKLKCFPDTLLETTTLKRLEFFENLKFQCSCLEKVRSFVEKNKIEVMYPAIICEDKARQINVVYNFNQTYQIPIFNN